ncbi:hypothetical protein BVRB_031350 [Beta vulgaris subsp. vulgaris]|uniref:Uncharacterized protein n=1 Tax=Beta vulgaris subsp. vulgaris TaxID=3555 RepID=A0A0J8AXG4_BETVV|nr:hypothetical protein BVRB_031350 [Beta vulgaris subsp. vulgaris]
MPRPVLSLENKGIRQIGAGPNQTFAYANKFVGPDKVSQGLDQFFADTRSLPSLREHHHVFGSTHYDDPVIMDVALNNSTIERILKQMTWRFDSKPYS